jgi:hypothetical protein
MPLHHKPPTHSPYVPPALSVAPMQNRLPRQTHSAALHRHTQAHPGHSSNVQKQAQTVPKRAVLNPHAPQGEGGRDEGVDATGPCGEARGLSRNVSCSKKKGELRSLREFSRILRTSRRVHGESGSTDWTGFLTNRFGRYSLA